MMEELFKNIGGEFITSFIRIAEKNKKIRVYIFDWDGVFNDGIKGDGISSPFYEADAMGVNMLRFAYWLRFRELPLTAIITGENNSSAFYFARREHIHTVYYSVRNKFNALQHLNQNYGISYEQTAYVYDDILDLPVAQQCGLRFLVRRNGSPVFNEYAKNKKLCDYITGNSSSQHPVREISELLLQASGEFNNVIEERISSGFNYNEYLTLRDALPTYFFTMESGIFIRKEPKI